MTSSLVGSEMCIRDRKTFIPKKNKTRFQSGGQHPKPCPMKARLAQLVEACLLYTSDAADDM
eukprot:4337875-Prorocentrum_lima.AAC.1